MIFQVTEIHLRKRTVQRLQQSGMAITALHNSKINDENHAFFSLRKQVATKSKNMWKVCFYIVSFNFDVSSRSRKGQVTPFRTDF
jgi:hypothetical protein